MFGAFIGIWEIIFLLLALVCFVVVVVVMVIGAIFFFKSRPQNTKGNQSPPAAPLPSTPAASTTQIFPAKCPQCGTPLPAGALAGLCPACLLKMGAATDTVTDAKQPPFNPPGVAELAAKFPQLEIIELIGKGGMGAVYKARQKQLDRIVALKILPPGIGHDAAFAERFAREAKALAKLNHPNIVTLYEFGDASGQFYFLMEFVDGVNLRQLLHNRRIAPREALAIVPQICDALQFAHDQGIVHRDIKPENILMDRRGRVKVADFGLAKIVGAERGCPSRSGDENAGAAGLTETLGQGGSAAGGTPALQELTDAGKIMGTPQYMSPEQITAPGEVDHRADIYALGVVFYQMLTGELPGKKIEPPSKKVQIDVRLDEIVLRALEKKPELRYQQVSEVKTCVETIAATPDESRRRGGESQTERPSADESRSQSLLTSSPTKGEPRFSRTAIVGACLCLPFVLSVMVFAFAALSRRATQSNVLANLVLNVTPFLGLFVGLPAILATTILGWMAVSQIRRSAGKLYGLWLAVFDGLLFPLLLLDGVVWVFGGLILMFFHLRMGLSAKLLLFLIPLIAIPVAVILDFLIIRRVWRAVNRPVEGSAPGAPQSKSGAARDIFRQPFEQAFGPRKKPDHFWRWFAVAVFAFISIPVVIAIIGLLAAIAIPNFVKARAQAQANARHAAELVATNLVFGPVMERVIPDSTRELGFALDFETGVLLNPPGNVSLHMLSEGVAFDTDPMNWARKYGGDLVAMPDGGVRFIEGVVSRQANESHLMTWDEFTPERVVADVNRLLTNPMVKMDGAWPQFYTASDRAPLAMAFITREHSQGVIQILGNSDNPPGVKIRYKLVQRLTATESNTPPASAETWSPTLAPGEKPDVSKIWNDAKDLMEQGKYEESLQRHIWYFNHALEYDPGQTGVRLSFALSQWVELGRRYPKAKQALLEIRDRDAQLLASGQGYAKLFMDVNSINNYLGQEDATLALFKTMYENDPKLAGECFYYAEDLLLKNGEYELLFKCVGDPQAHFESARRGFEVLIESQQRMAEMRKKYPAPQLPAGAFRPPDMMQLATNNFVGQVCKLVEILVATGHSADAEKIQNEAVKVLDDARLQSAVRDATKNIHDRLLQEQTGRTVTIQSPGGTMQFNVTSTAPASVTAATQYFDVATHTLTVSEPATMTIGTTVNVDERAAIYDWLALMDAGAYPQSWDTAADIFHKATTKDAWMKLSGEVRQPLGRLVSRKEISTQSSQTLPGLPRGFYFIAQFETSFAELTNAVETVAVIQKSARQWRIVSYLIRPRTAEQTAAVTAAQKWLAGIDAGNYAASWTDAAESFQGAITQDKWVSAMESVRKPLGGLKIRTVDSTVTETQMPGAPDGKYVVMQFETTFAKKNSAIETVTFVLEKDGQWKASGYYIK